MLLIHGMDSHYFVFDRNIFKTKLTSLLTYFVIIPFVYPKGFSEYFLVYKNLFITWLYFAVFAVFILFISNVRNIKYKKSHCIIICYFLYMFIDTFVIRYSFENALQKIFASPALYIFCCILISKNAYLFIKSLANILIVLFFLNFFIFNPFFFDNYFDPDRLHLLFIGHVQVASQLGLIGVFIGYLLLYRHNVRKASKLIVLSIVTMIMSKTIASLFVISCLLVGFTYISISKRHYLLQLNPIIYLVLTTFINVIFLILTYVVGYKFSFLGEPTTFNGRTTIWRNALELVSQELIFGYGAAGVKIQVYWSMLTKDSLGMYYAHNELIQELLNGGIILLALFCFVIFFHIVYLKNVKSKKLFYFSNLSFFIFSFIMIFESPTEYQYIYIFLAMLAYLPEIENSFTTYLLDYFKLNYSSFLDKKFK